MLCRICTVCTDPTYETCPTADHTDQDLSALKDLDHEVRIEDTDLMSDV